MWGKIILWEIVKSQKQEVILCMMVGIPMLDHIILQMSQERGLDNAAAIATPCARPSLSID